MLGKNVIVDTCSSSSAQQSGEEEEEEVTPVFATEQSVPEVPDTPCAAPHIHMQRHASPVRQHLCPAQHHTSPAWPHASPVRQHLSPAWQEEIEYEPAGQGEQIEIDFDQYGNPFEDIDYDELQNFFGI